MEDRTIIELSCVAAVTGLQLVAWYMGYNGQVFALTSAVIGAVAGIGLVKGVQKK